MKLHDPLQCNKLVIWPSAQCRHRVCVLTYTCVISGYCDSCTDHLSYFSLPCRLRAGLPPYAPAFTSWIHCWRYLSSQVREQGTHSALGSFHSFLRALAPSSGTCAAFLMCSVTVSILPVTAPVPGMAVLVCSCYLSLQPPTSGTA